MYVIRLYVTFFIDSGVLFTRNGMLYLIHFFLFGLCASTRLVFFDTGQSLLVDFC